MGCVQSTPQPNGDEEYIETLTLKRKVSKKPPGSQNLQIQISVIADPLSSDEEGGAMMCQLHKSKSRIRNSSIKTMSFAEGRRFTKFPNMVGYKMCVSCNETRKDVLKTINPDVEKEICRKCSVHHRKESKKKMKKCENKPDDTDKKTPENLSITSGEQTPVKVMDVSRTPEKDRYRDMIKDNSLSVSALQETMKKMDIAALASLLALVKYINVVRGVVSNMGQGFQLTQE